MQVIKVAYNNVLRRFTISEGARWEDIAAQVRRFTLLVEAFFDPLFPQIRQLPGISALNGGYTVQYRDAENDLVTIDSDSELADLMRLSTSAIRFEVVPKNASLPSDEQPSFFAIENTEEAVGSADEPEPMETEASEANEGDASGPKDKQKAPLPDSFAAAFEQISTLIGQSKGMFQDKPEVLARINEFAARLLNVDGTNSEADVQGEYPTLGITFQLYIFKSNLPILPSNPQLSNATSSTGQPTSSNTSKPPKEPPGGPSTRSTGWASSRVSKGSKNSTSKTSQNPKPAHRRLIARSTKPAEDAGIPVLTAAALGDRTITAPSLLCPARLRFRSPNQRPRRSKRKSRS
jgi:hypothetical protein